MKIDVSEGRPVGLHNEALVEAGKALMISSVDVGRDFCKSMIATSTGAIPIYVALVAFSVGKDFRPDFGQGILLMLAPIALLLSAVAFAYGYFPASLDFSVEVVDQIATARTATINKRIRWSAIGFGLLILGIALSVFGVFYGLSIHSTPRMTP
jgi:hypothetical protein